MYQHTKHTHWSSMHNCGCHFVIEEVLVILNHFLLFHSSENKALRPFQHFIE